MLNKSPINFQRLRKLRQNSQMRQMLQETHLRVEDLIYPLFIKEGLSENKPILSMPNQYQMALGNLAEEAKEIQKLGIRAVLLFGIPSTKDALGQSGYDKLGIIARAIQTIKEAAPDLMVISDVCCCEYTDHGHCGFIDEQSKLKDVHNDKTLDLIVSQALVHAQSGVDMVAPSGMMDGAVAAIRHALDREGFESLPIMGYSIKYASSLYGPFREAAEGAPQFGDRQTYQMNIANAQEAIREAKADIAEGADILMVKPAGMYMDIIHQVKKQFPDLPLAAYQVSGEYAMIKAAALNGWLDESKIVYESLLSLKRAGADLLITYFAKDVAHALHRG